MGDAQYVKNVHILNSVFSTNYAGVILEANEGRNTTNYITVNDNQFSNHRFVGLVWRNPGTGSSYSGNTFTNEVVDVCEGSGCN